MMSSLNILNAASAMDTVFENVAISQWVWYELFTIATRGLQWNAMLIIRTLDSVYFMIFDVNK